MSELRAAIVQNALDARNRTLGLSETESQYELETGAMPSFAAYESWSEPFSELLGIVEARGTNNPSVYMDTTTVWTAFRLIDGDSSILNAQTLMDLDKVTRSIVLNDSIFHLPNAAIDPRVLNERLGEDVFVALDPVNTQPTVDRILWEIWYYSVPAIVNGQPLSEMSWTEHALETLRADDSRHIFADLAAFSGFELEERYWNIQADGSTSIFSSDPSELVRNLTAKSYVSEGVHHLDEELLNTSLLSSDRRRDFLVEQVRDLVHRATFHQLLSEMLGLVYDPSFVRMPSIAHLTKNSHAISLAFSDVMKMEELIEESRSSVAGDAILSDPPRVKIPAFTSYVLSRVKALSEWWDVVADLRQRSRRYRRSRRDFQEAIFFGDLKALAPIRDEFSGANVVASEEIVDATLGVAAAAFEMGSMALGAPSVFGKPVANALQILISRPTKAGVNALRRRFNPRVRLIHDVASAVTGYLYLENKIRLLWNLNKLPAGFNRFETYAQRFPSITRNLL